MNKNSIREELNQRILVMDGAMGTMLHHYGLVGKLPEELNFTHPEVIETIYRDYLAAGSQVLSTNTFGANSYKLYGTGYDVAAVVEQSVAIARKVIAGALERKTNGMPWVALDVAPIGRLMEPTGDLSFEEACSLFAEQIRAGIKAEVDLILFETFTDIHEMKAAVVTARELTDLPIFCSVTFQPDGRMLMGTDPLTVVNILQDLGIDALGVNCSLGPAQMIPIVKEMLSYSKLPVLVQPNAGLPRMAENGTVFDVGVAEYTDAMEELILAGVRVVGGCCGTNPDYIRSLSERIKAIGDTIAYTQSSSTNHERGHLTPFPPAGYRGPFTAASSGIKTVVLDDRIRVIGERINPTGKKLLKEALKSNDFTYIENEAISQVRAGAEILDVNVGLPGIEEAAMMEAVVRRISAVTDAPLQIDSADPKVLEAAARIYNGRPIVNSVNGKQEVMDAVFPIVKKYGTNVIALTLDEKGLPTNTKERLDIAERILLEAQKYGIGKERILLDCLTLTVSAEQNAGLDTLEAIRKAGELFGVKTTLGASNVSFGLPERKLLNTTFLAMALAAGLSAPITDPLVPEYMDTIRAYEVLAAKDKDSMEYIALYGQRKAAAEAGNAGAPAPGQSAGGLSPGQSAGGLSPGQSAGGLSPGQSAGGLGPGQSAGGRNAGPNTTHPKEEISPEDRFRDIVINGYVDRAQDATGELLQTRKPLEIVEQLIIPALTMVGQQYETGEIFLPQLVRSADTVSASFSVLKEAMESSGESLCYGKVLLATVKGDIHDIGKNIAKALLENYGYQVIDLGKDVDIEPIVRTAAEEGVKMVGLSALMTTTVANMEATIKAIREAGLDCKIAVGGAVLNREYAKIIKADYYCKDAMEGVRVADEIYKK